VPARPRLRIYGVAAPRVSETSVREFASRFGLAARGTRTGILESDDARLTYREGSHVVTQYRASGGFRYHDATRWQVDDGRSSVDIDDEAAVELARGYVKKHRLAPLRECRVLKVARLHVASADRDGKQRDERVVDVAVAFQRTVDKIPVDGPGGKVIVYLDHEGALTGADVLWHTLTRSRREVRALRPLDAVAEEASAFLGARRGGRIEVRQVRFGYFELGWQERQRYLQPAYVILMTLYSDDERIHRRTVYVATAATNGVGRITPPLEPAAKQTPRQR
jgi:hypothetical protein